jgi:hypothetical protein
MQRGLDALHSTLQLIVLEGDAEKTRGALLSTARLLLPLSASLFILSLLLARGAQWGIRAWLAVRPWVPFLRRPLVLVIGCGASGLKLARYYALGRMAVIGIDRDIDSANARRFRAGGFQTLAFEFDAPDDVRALPLRSAGRVVVCTGDDARDLEICRNLLRAGVAQRVTVTFETPEVNRVVQFDPLFADRDAPNAVNFLDLDHFSARLLFREKPPHVYRREQPFAAGAANACHIALVMSPPRAETYLPQAVRALVYSPDHPLRVSLFTENAAACEQRLRSRYPALFGPPRKDDDPVYGGQRPLADVAVHESTAAQVNVAELRAVHRAQPVDVVYVLGGDDAETALLLTEVVKGVDVLADPKPAVVAGFSTAVAVAKGRWESPRPRATSSADDPIGPLTYVFDELGSTGLRVEWLPLDAWVNASPPARIEETPDAFADTLACAVHAAYGEGRGESWTALPEHERWFNRYAVDHALIKLALLEATQEGAANHLGAALAAHDDWLARLEHRRYACERMLDGWVRRIALDDADPAAMAEGRPKLNRYHLNPTLQPFAALPEDQRDKDRAIVKLLNTLRAELRGPRRPPAADPDAEGGNRA